MKYNEIISLYDYFQPVYDITNEKKDYWKQFIPTKDFLEILDSFLDSLIESEPKKRKSIWIQGSYGTGKSHATGVIKHLLYDPVYEIEDYIKKINDSKVKQKLQNFRSKNRIFPVTLKGVSGIYDSKSFVLTIEKEVKNSLNKFGFEVIIKSEFEKYLEYIKQDNKTINWENIINNNLKLKSLVKDINGLETKLYNKDVEVLKLLDETIEFMLPIETIDEWISEVASELMNKNISTSLALYWDEFTSVMEAEKSTQILNILQNIAELTIDGKVYLFLVSHKHPQQVSNYLDKEDYEKILSRFHDKSYRMENITTFHIIGNAIQKEDEQKWVELKEKKLNENDKLKKVIWKIVEEKNIQDSSTLSSVFPLHPYTALLATKLSEHIGSTQRSIFNFLYDENYGFIKFINEYPKEINNEEEYFLTPDLLWDFFLNEFEKSNDERVIAVLEKYKLLSQFENKGHEYVAIYKGILLLNILYYDVTTTDKSQPYFPTIDNMRAMFYNTVYEKYVDDVLKFIDEKEYISKTPDELFLVTSSNLPPLEVEEEKRKITQEYSDILKAFNSTLLDNINNYFCSDILRETVIKVYSANKNDFDIKNKINKEFEGYHKLNLVMFLAKNENELASIKQIINSLKNDEIIRNKNIIFMISESIFGDKNFERLVNYEARRRVSQKHSFDNDVKLYERYVNDIIEQWINDIKNGQIHIIYDEDIVKSSKDVSEYINNTISKKIFTFGPETIEDLTSNRNIWPNKKSEKIIEIFLFNEDLNNLENECKSGYYKPLLSILKSEKGQNIVNKNLLYIDLNNPDQFVIKIQREVDKVIQDTKGSDFNLADKLDFLRKPPFGLYPNMISAAVLGFVMRKYVGKLYEFQTGTKVQKDIMRNKIVFLFNYWNDEKDKDKLNLRLGTPEEEKLLDLLRYLFDIKKEGTFNATVWEIGEWIKKSGYPLWLLKELTTNDSINRSIDAILYLIKAVDKEINDENIKKIYKLLDSIKIEIKTLLNYDNLKAGFIQWLKKKNIEFSENELEDILKYVFDNMQEEIKLWEESKVETQIVKWYANKGKLKIEFELIDLIKEIFKIEKADSLSELKIELRNKINNDIKVPLWIFSIKFSDEIKEIIDNIDNFINNNESAFSREDQLPGYIEKIKINKNLVNNAINQNNIKGCLISWLQNKNINIKNFEEFYNFFINIINNKNTAVYSLKVEDLLQIINKYIIAIKIKDLLNIKFIKIDTIDDFQQQIINWIYDNLHYPFWSFGLYKDTETNEIVNFIIKFIESTKVIDNEDNLNKVVDIIDKRENELKNIFNMNNCKDNFFRWLQNDLGIISDDIKRTADDIRRNMENSFDFFYNQDKVEIWIHKNLSSLIDESTKKRVIAKIQNSNKDIKEIFIKLIEKHPEVCTWTEELL